MSPGWKRRLPAAAPFAVAAFAGLLAWMWLRPDRVAELDEVAPGLVAYLRQAFPQGPEVPPPVALRLRETTGGRTFMRREAVDAPAPQVVRRSSTRSGPVNEAGGSEEANALAIGPVELVRHRREPMPLAGALLPRHFWHSRVLRRVAVKEGSRFPGEPGETFEATRWTEDLTGDGGRREWEASQLVCRSLERRPAQEVYRGVSGGAIRVQCEETSPPPPSQASPGGALPADAPARARWVVRTESWYLEALRVSVPASVREAWQSAQTPPDVRETVFTLERIDLVRP